MGDFLDWRLMNEVSLEVLVLYHGGKGLSNGKRSFFVRDLYNADRMDILDGQINRPLD
jgi:hypothetical protein